MSSHCSLREAVVARPQGVYVPNLSQTTDPAAHPTANTLASISSSGTYRALSSLSCYPYFFGWVCSPHSWLITMLQASTQMSLHPSPPLITLSKMAHPTCFQQCHYLIYGYISLLPITPVDYNLRGDQVFLEYPKSAPNT